ncbi:MAG: diacylglycerol kinase family protein [Pirellula sp.]
MSDLEFSSEGHDLVNEEGETGFSWKARAWSFVHAFRGLSRLIQTQHNAWIHLTFSCAMLVIAAFLQINAMEWCWLLASLGSIWVAEAFNTALEFLADAACPNHHPLVRDAKDVAAGAVLVVAIIAATNVAVLFFPYLKNLLMMGT